MKDIEQINKSIRSCEGFIASHKKQVEYFTNEEFDSDKASQYLQKIKLLQVELDCLKWVVKD